MTFDGVLAYTARTVELGLLAGGPLLATALTVGIAIGVFQAATQLQDAAVGFVPKLMAMAVAIVTLGPFTIAQLTSFMRESIAAIANFAP